jgi:hypothetical protein
VWACPACKVEVTDLVFHPVLTMEPQNVKLDLGAHYVDKEDIIDDVKITVLEYLDLKNMDNIMAVFTESMSGTVHIKSIEGPPRLIGTFTVHMDVEEE